MIVYRKLLTNVKGNKRGRVISYSCDYTKNCDHFNQGKCVCEDLYFEEIRCPHAKRGRETSPVTARAKSYWGWKQNVQEAYKTDIKVANEKVCYAGDYVYIPLPHLKNYINSLEKIENKYFVLRDDFGEDMVQEIVTYQPISLMGEIITSYQGKIPKFLAQLKEAMPDIYVSWSEKYPETAEKYDLSKANIGRTAYVSTLPQGSEIVDCHKNIWEVVGNEIVCENVGTSIMNPFGGWRSETKVAITITDDMTVEVGRNTAVDADTKYVD